MRPFRLIAILLLALAMALPAYAEHLPENDLINKDMAVEKDTNIVKDTLDNEIKLDEEEKEPSEEEKDPNAPDEFVMTNKKYRSVTVKPVIILTLIGLLLYLLPTVKGFIKDRNLFSLPVKKKGSVKK